MPAHRIGIAPMTPAERQARHRAKLRRHSQTMPPGQCGASYRGQDGGGRR